MDTNDAPGSSFCLLVVPMLDLIEKDDQPAVMKPWAAAVRSVTSWMFVLAGIAMCGCQSVHNLSNAQPLAVPLRPDEAIFIIVPKDAPDEPGSGRSAATALQSMFQDYAQRIKLSDEIATTETHLNSARAGGFSFLVEPLVWEWKEEPTEWSGVSDKLDVTLRLLRVSTGEVAATARIKSKSTFWTLGGDKVEHLLIASGKTWVQSLYAR